MVFYYSEEVSDLEQEIVKLKQENAELHKQLKDKETCAEQTDKELQPNYLISFWTTDKMNQQGVGNVMVYFHHRPSLSEINQLLTQLQTEFNLLDVKILAINELGSDFKEENK